MYLIRNYKNCEIFSFSREFGLYFYIELPSDWHEDQYAMINFCFIFGRFYIAFPWYKSYPDHYQCSGPRFGFQFYKDLLWIYHGNSTGNSKDKSTTSFYMPWHWDFKRHTVLSEPETHDYTYKLNSGELQHRTATIYAEEREWCRFWYPNKLISKSINVDFNDEVGEQTGSWKGGTIGCGYEMKEGESPLETLRRMESERRFN